MRLKSAEDSLLFSFFVLFFSSSGYKQRKYNWSSDLLSCPPLIFLSSHQRCTSSKWRWRWNWDGGVSVKTSYWWLSLFDLLDQQGHLQHLLKNLKLLQGDDVEGKRGECGHRQCDHRGLDLGHRLWLIVLGIFTKFNSCVVMSISSSFWTALLLSIQFFSNCSSVKILN